MRGDAFYMVHTFVLYFTYVRSASQGQFVNGVTKPLVIEIQWFFLVSHPPDIC